MARLRAERVAEQMKKELADLLRTDVKDPRVGFATLTRVEVAGDLQHVKAYVSVLGDEEAKNHTLSALTRMAGYLRGELARRLHLRLTPELVFRLDESGEYSARIESVLRELRKESQGEA
ncbi:MAG: 30S ribosome-binding factor RbfA [Alicyclobacillus herbarius]|uniref:30S ribosome-binding factor RbfA n=1 Tax=Alicyclobacillus herbarius TaxID=122960 RepID=UPI0004221BF1|nr:30S ribosome-binding factor RbfA [Alicyclobacillus herbarius]MCL6632017.1 30S ribosome-binding factor RbfA [Alicyclobacillus herbarius]